MNAYWSEIIIIFYIPYKGTKRLTRSRSGKVQQRHENETKKTENEATTSKLAMRKPIRSQSGQDEEKCNMQWKKLSYNSENSVLFLLFFVR